MPGASGWESRHARPPGRRTAAGFGIPPGVRFLAVAALVASLALAGCGYSIVRYAGGLGDVRTVAVKTPRNDSYEPGLGRMVADAIRREFLARGAVRVVESPGAADLVLEGRVLPIVADADAFTSTGRALEHHVAVQLELSAVRRDGSSVALSARELRESERYRASADAEAERKNRIEALRRACQLLAGRVYDALHLALAP